MAGGLNRSQLAPQPAPSAPPAVIRGISAKIAVLSGQTCNHAVVNRYRDGGDSIGAHSDKALDLVGAVQLECSCDP